MTKDWFFLIFFGSCHQNWAPLGGQQDFICILISAKSQVKRNHECGAHGKIDSACADKWCEALSSADRPLRGLPWSDGRVTPNDPQNDPFGWHQLHESNLDHQISIGGNSSDYLGKFSLWFWIHTRSLSLKHCPIPFHRRWKSRNFDVLEIDSGAIRWCLGVTRDILEGALMPPEDHCELQ